MQFPDRLDLDLAEAASVDQKAGTGCDHLTDLDHRAKTMLMQKNALEDAKNLLGKSQLI